MDSKNWRFSVQYERELLPGEGVYITGSEPSLGNWEVRGAVPLNKSSENTWEVEIPISRNKSVYYRYCVCYSFTQHSEPILIVREWETYITPRKISVKDDLFYSQDVFGHFRKKSEYNTVQKGWLTNETYVEFKLQGESVVLWKRKHLGKKIFIRVSGIETSRCNNASSFDFEESIDVHSDPTHKNKTWPIIEICKLHEDQCVPKPQGQFGVLYEDQEFLSVQAYVLSLPTVAFLVDFYINDDVVLKEGEHPKHIGSCYVMPDQLKSTEGKVMVPIVSRGFQPVGQFNASYLVVHPMRDVKCDFAVSFATHWRPVWKGLEVGHRGLGNSFDGLNCSFIRENSIASLRHALEHGADMVEFDVQLSKDLVPVIYHDFFLCTIVMHKKKRDENFFVEMPLKNLTLEELQKYKIYNKHEKDEGLKEFLDHEDNEAFPTLERALNELNEDGAFNIEVKWDMELKDGTRENHNAFEINLFADTLIKTVLTHGRSRPIVFSSFNPDICTAFRKKQNQYPVLLLTVGVNTKYDPYMDARTWNIANSSLFVEMIDILGVNAMAEDIQRDPSQVELVKSKNRVLFCWTDDKNDKDTVEQLKKIGVDGVIFDRMDEHKNGESKQQPRFKFVSPVDEEADEEEREFLKKNTEMNRVYDKTKAMETSNEPSSFSGLFSKNANFEVTSPSG